jgi:hypothetical protein
MDMDAHSSEQVLQEVDNPLRQVGIQHVTDKTIQVDA